MEQLVRAMSARVPPKLTACLNFFGGAKLSRLNFNGGLPKHPASKTDSRCSVSFELMGLETLEAVVD